MDIVIISPQKNNNSLENIINSVIESCSLHDVKLKIITEEDFNSIFEKLKLECLLEDREAIKDKGRKEKIILIIDGTSQLTKDSKRESSYSWPFQLIEFIKFDPDLNRKIFFPIVITVESPDAYFEISNDNLPLVVESSSEKLVILKTPFNIKHLIEIIKNVIKSDSEKQDYIEFSYSRIIGDLLIKTFSDKIQLKITVIEDELKKKDGYFCNDCNNGNCNYKEEYYCELIKKIKEITKVSVCVYWIKNMKGLEKQLSEDLINLENAGKNEYINNIIGSDIIFLDILMKDENQELKNTAGKSLGIEICKLLKKRFPFIPVIAITHFGVGNINTHESGLKLEPSYYQTKIIKIGADNCFQKIGDKEIIERNAEAVIRHISKREWLLERIKNYVRKRFITDLTGKFNEKNSKEKWLFAYLINKIFSDFDGVYLISVPSEGLSGNMLFFVKPIKGKSPFDIHLIKIGNPWELSLEKLGYENYIKGYSNNYVARIESAPIIADEVGAIKYTAVGDASDFERGPDFYPLSMSKYIKNLMKNTSEENIEKIKQIFNLLLDNILSKKGLYKDISPKTIDIKELFFHYLPPIIIEDISINKIEARKNGQCKTFVLEEIKKGISNKENNEKKYCVVLKGYELKNNKKIKAEFTLSSDNLNHDNLNHDNLNQLYKFANDPRLVPGKIIYINVNETNGKLENKLVKFCIIDNDIAETLGLRQIIESGEEIAKTINEVKNNYEFHISTIHGDFHLDNVMVSHWLTIEEKEKNKENLWLIDFEKVKKGPTVADLAQLEFSVYWQIWLDELIRIYEIISIESSKVDLSIVANIIEVFLDTQYIENTNEWKNKFFENFPKKNKNIIKFFDDDFIFRTHIVKWMVHKIHNHLIHLGIKPYEYNIGAAITIFSKHKYFKKNYEKMKGKTIQDLTNDDLKHIFDFMISILVSNAYAGKIKR